MIVPECCFFDRDSSIASLKLVLKLIKLVCEVTQLTTTTTVEKVEKEPTSWVDVMSPVGKLSDLYPAGGLSLFEMARALLKQRFKKRFDTFY